MGIKRFFCCFVLAAAAVLFLAPSAEAQSAKCDVAAARSLAAGTETLQDMIPNLPPAPQEKGPVCEFCNLTSFSSCEALNGNSCGAPGMFRRCYIEPACLCEWGGCLCSGGAWSCFW